MKSGPRSVESKNAAGNAGSGAQATSTHPATRTIDAGRAGQSGSVKATPVPVPDIKAAEALRQKPQNPRQPVSVTSQPTNESNASSLQVPLDEAARVTTDRTYDKGEK
jgi:hypothetical protein